MNSVHYAIGKDGKLEILKDSQNQSDGASVKSDDPLDNILEASSSKSSK